MKLLKRVRRPLVEMILVNPTTGATLSMRNHSTHKPQLKHFTFQLSVFGFRNTTPETSPQGSALLRPSPSHQLLFSATQTDAFALFQAIAAQVL